MERVKNTGKTEQFVFSTGGSWHEEPIHGIAVYIAAKQKWVRYSPRHVAISRGMYEFWAINRGHQFTWEETLRSVSQGFLRHAGHLKRGDYTKGKEILRELGPSYRAETGELFSYASTRGPHAVAGFVAEVVEARKYEERNHQMFKVMEDRVANGTVVPAGAEFEVPVKKSNMKTRTL